MGGGHVAVAEVVKADLHADDGAAAVAAENVEAAAGAQADDGVLALGEGRERLDARVEAGHQFVHLRLKAEHGGDGRRVVAHALHHADLCIGGEEHHGRDLAERVVGGAQPAADEDDVRLAGHHRFEVGLLDGAEVGNGIAGNIGLQVFKRRRRRADHAVAQPKAVEYVQRRHIEDGDALRVVGHFQLDRLALGVQGSDGDGLGRGLGQREGRRAQQHQGGKQQRNQLFHGSCLLYTKY